MATKTTRPLTVEAHMGLVHSLARSYRWALRGGSLELKDLVQDGAMGLMRALQTFDPTRGAFSTYARYWIRHAITRSIENTAYTIRHPTWRWAAGDMPQTTASLDASRGNSEWTLHESLPSDSPDPLELLEEARRAGTAHAALDALEDRARLVVESCTMGDEPLASVARRIPSARGGCLTRERARQIQQGALSRLRKEIRHPESE